MTVASASVTANEPNEVVQSQFCLVQDFENGLVKLYHKCSEPLPDGVTQTPNVPAFPTDP